LFSRAWVRSTENRERIVHQQTRGLRQHSLCLLDEHAAVQRAPQLLGDNLRFGDDALLEQADGRNIRQGLPDLGILTFQFADGGKEEVHGADNLATKAQPRGVGGQKTLPQSRPPKHHPSVIDSLDIGHRHRFSRW